MNINKTHDDGKIALTLTGNLDTSTSPQFSKTLLPLFDEEKLVVLDFSNVAYVSSAGLRVLITGHETAKSKKATMLLHGVSDEIMGIFKMTGFSNILNIE